MGSSRIFIGLYIVDVLLDTLLLVFENKYPNFKK